MYLKLLLLLFGTSLICQGRIHGKLPKFDIEHTKQIDVTENDMGFIIRKRYNGFHDTSVTILNPDRTRFSVFMLRAGVNKYASVILSGESKVLSINENNIHRFPRFKRIYCGYDENMTLTITASPLSFSPEFVFFYKAKQSSRKTTATPKVSTTTDSNLEPECHVNNYKTVKPTTASCNTKYRLFIVSCGLQETPVYDSFHYSRNSVCVPNERIYYSDKHKADDHNDNFLYSHISWLSLAPMKLPLYGASEMYASQISYYCIPTKPTPQTFSAQIGLTKKINVEENQRGFLLSNRTKNSGNLKLFNPKRRMISIFMITNNLQKEASLEISDDLGYYKTLYRSDVDSWHHKKILYYSDGEKVELKLKSNDNHDHMNRAFKIYYEVSHCASNEDEIRTEEPSQTFPSQEITQETIESTFTSSERPDFNDFIRLFSYRWAIIIYSICAFLFTLIVLLSIYAITVSIRKLRSDSLPEDFEPYMDEKQYYYEIEKEKQSVDDEGNIYIVS